MKGFAQGLALKQRRKTTRKWVIAQRFFPGEILVKCIFVTELYLGLRSSPGHIDTLPTAGKTLL